MCPKGTSPYSFSGDGIETINPTVGRVWILRVYPYISYKYVYIYIQIYIYIYIHQEINTEPENNGLEDVFPFQTGD